MILTNITALGALLILLTITAATGQDPADTQPGSGVVPGSDPNQPPAEDSKPPIADPDTNGQEVVNSQPGPDGQPPVEPPVEQNHLELLFDMCEAKTMKTNCVGSKIDPATKVPGAAVRNGEGCFMAKDCDALVSVQRKDDEATKSSVTYMLAKNDITASSVVFFLSKGKVDGTVIDIGRLGLPPGHVGMMLANDVKASNVTTRPKDPPAPTPPTTPPPTAVADVARFFQDPNDPPTVADTKEPLPFKFLPAEKKKGSSQMTFFSVEKLKYSAGDYEVDLDNDEVYPVLAIKPVAVSDYSIASTNDAAKFLPNKDAPIPPGPDTGNPGPPGPDTGNPGPPGPDTGNPGPPGPDTGNPGPPGPDTGNPGPPGPDTGNPGPPPEDRTKAPKKGSTTAAPMMTKTTMIALIVAAVAALGLVILAIWYCCCRDTSDKVTVDIEQAKPGKPQLVATPVAIVTAEDEAAVEDKEVQQEMLKEEKMEATGVIEAAEATKEPTSMAEATQEAAPMAEATQEPAPMVETQQEMAAPTGNTDSQPIEPSATEEPITTAKTDESNSTSSE